MLTYLTHVIVQSFHFAENLDAFPQYFECNTLYFYKSVFFLLISLFFGGIFLCTWDGFQLKIKFPSNTRWFIQFLLKCERVCEGMSGLWQVRSFSSVPTVLKGICPLHVKYRTLHSVGCPRTPFQCTREPTVSGWDSKWPVIRASLRELLPATPRARQAPNTHLQAAQPAMWAGVPRGYSRTFLPENQAGLTPL